MNTEAKKEHYWICFDCAEQKGWKPVPYAVTCIKKECPYCGNEALLACSHNDFIKNGKGPKTWD